MAEALLGLGGNLGDARATIVEALRRLDAAGARILRRSGYYRTAPWGGVVQPDFVNLCAAVRTELNPDELLERTQAIEREGGRTPGPRWGPRPIDIDILDYEGVTLDTPRLTLPHPRLNERAFVLVPLAEIAPEREIRGRTVRDWAEQCDRTGIVRL